MITDFSSLPGTLVKLALDMHSVQHNLLATNIANANTQQYHRVTLEFNRIYEDMSKLAEEGDLTAQADNIQANINASAYLSTSNEKGVELDRELIGLSENTVQYKALLSALASRGDIMQIAIKGEKR